MISSAIHAELLQPHVLPACAAEGFFLTPAPPAAAAAAPPAAAAAAAAAEDLPLPSGAHMACCSARPLAETKPWLPADVTANLPALEAVPVTDGFHTMPMGSLLPQEQLVVTLCLRRYG
jgi:hypothetical protein